MSSAFDTVDHTLLLSKLEYYGIQNQELALMSSFLSGRKQYVEIDGIKSEILDSIDCSVIQGSKMSSLLYTLYVNKVPLLHNIMDNNTFKLIALCEQVQIYGNSVTHLAMNYIDDTSNAISCNDCITVQNYINNFFILVEKF